MLKAVIRILLPMAVCVSWCLAQGTKVYTIDTVVGGAVYDGLPATSTPLNAPNGLWLDRNGALWLAETGSNVIRRIDPATGVMNVVVGGGTAREDATPIPGTSLQLDSPSNIAGDDAGNIYFSESGGNRVHKLTPDGQVSTVVGTGEAGFSGDGGLARLAKLNGPTGIVFDAAGNLYISDALNCRIRRVDTLGTITTFAGNGQCGQQAGDGGLAASAVLGNWLQGLAFDSRGNLYAANWVSIRRIDATSGIITLVAGMGPQRFADGTPATAGSLNKANSMVFDPDGNLYFTENSGLVKLTAATGLLTKLGGLGANSAGLVRDGNGNLIFAAADSGLISRVAATGGPQATLAGTSEVFDGPGPRAVLAQPMGVCLDSTGRLYIADASHSRIRRYDPSTGLVTTVIGGGSTPMADGVAATSAQIGGASGVFADAQGNILFDQRSSLWKMDAATGKVARIAGSPNGQSGYSGDGGPATQATFSYIRAAVADSAGNVFIADTGNNRVRRIDAATGIITTVAGNGTGGSSGDGGPGTTAALNNPGGLAFDRQGQLLIATGAGTRFLNITSGVISGVQSRNRDGGPLGATPGGRGVAVDKDGNIFIWTGTSVSQVRASDSMLLNVAGSSVAGFFGDGGLASRARLSSVKEQGGIAADTSGNLYISDSDNSRVRKLSLTVVQPALAVSPGTVFFTALQGSSLISAQQLTIGSANGLGFNWTLAVTTTAGGNWLSAITTSGAVSGAGQSTVILTVDASRLGAGTYRGTVTITAAGTTNSPQTVEVVLTVTGAAGAALGVSQQYLNFQAVAGGANPAPQTLSINNVGSGTLSWSATAETSSGGQWLRISSGLGTAPSTLTISADITGLAQGTYQGRVVLRNLVAGDNTMVSVVLNVTRTQPILLPTQTGFLFTGVEGSLVVGPQSFAIQNAGQGKMDWQVAVNLPAGGDWLRVSPTSGSTDASQPQAAPTVTLLVDPGKLRAGVQVGLLTITAAGALNSPQTAIVLVNMLSRGSAPVGTINPLGLIFTSLAGSSGTLTQGISIATTGGQALQFLARTQTQAGAGWLSVTPEQGVLLSSSETAGLSVQAQPTGLSAGVYVGSVILNFGTGVTQEVAVALVVAPGTSTAAVRRSSSELGTGDLGPGTPAAACTARRLVVVETKLGNRFSAQTGWPIPMLVQIVDDCGAAASTATVTASFTGGEPSLVFQNLRNGQYSATWVPARSGSIGVTIRATGTGLEDGVAQFAGTLGQASMLPLIFRDGWVNAASFDRFKPLAPGMIFSVFGNNLADGKNLASQIPLPRTLGNLKATMAGYEVPLFYADGGQVNGQVPFEVPVGTASLVVTGKGSAGAPGTVTIVGAQPGIFTFSQSGTGQGIVLSADNRLADTKNPVHAGDTVVIYATGLGATNPPVATGQSAPAVPPLALVTTPTKVTIGGLEATVDFAGLAPGFVGLYQVNARIPAAVAAGNAVPLVITQNGIASNTVTIAIQ